MGEAPPRSAANSLQGLVVKLRRSLGADAVVTSAVGYRLAVPDDALDARRFEVLVASARDAVAAGRAADALGDLDRALALWRGSPLADFAYEDWARAEVARLDEIHAGALEARFDALLALGRHGEAAAELEAAVGRYPLRERLRGQLMLALYRAGRQADALRAYQDLRSVLGDELGLDPSAELRRLESAILAHDPSLDLAPAAMAVARAGAPVAVAADRPRPPTNLRASLTALVGRADELRELEQLVERHRLVTITGPGGAGKTRLALEAARNLSARFAEGAWMVELASLTDESDVAVAVATALELADPTVDSRSRVADTCATARFWWCSTTASTS